MVETTGQIHAMGHGLEDVSFEAQRDFKVRVAGIELSARRGETTKMPYWVGRALEDNGFGHVSLPDMITALKQALAKERIGGPREFQTLEPLFYVKLKATMRRLEGRDYDRVYGMLLELFRMRNAKIVTKASSMKMGMDMKRRLTVEEQAFYNEINQTCNGFESQITNAPSDFDQDSGTDDNSVRNNNNNNKNKSQSITITDLSDDAGSGDAPVMDYDEEQMQYNPAGADARVSESKIGGVTTQ